MIEKAAILRQINVYDENNDLNVDVEEQWDLRSCMPCMHPGIVDQTDNGLSVEEEWNILIIEQSDEEDEILVMVIALIISTKPTHNLGNL